MSSSRISCINDVLPAEILSEILVCCADGPMDPDHSVRTPLMLSWVCQHWRTTALSTPLLWRRLFIKITLAGSTVQTEKTNAWMDRSGDCALTIFVFWEEHPSVDVSHSALEAMMRHSHRWYHLFVYLPLHVFPFLCRVRGNVPLLRMLSVGCNEIPVYFKGLNAFEIAPRLHTYECINVYPFQFILPWAQLESIPAMSGSPQECLVIQTRCPRLKDANFMLSLWPRADEDEILIPPPPFQMQDLHSVNFKFTISPWATFVDANPVFERVTYPNLRNLQLCDFTLAPMPHLHAFLLRSPHLQTLSLRRVNMIESDLLQCLEATPSLVNLELLEEEQLTFGNVLGELTLKRLIHQPGEASGILPKLRHLVVSTSSIPLDLFLDMIESRFLTRDAALKSAILDTEVDLDEDSAERYDSLRQQGLNIVIAPLSWL